MLNVKTKAILASVFLASALLALSVGYQGGIASAKEEPACAPQILRGTYGNSFQFLNLTTGPEPPQPIGAGTQWPGAGISLYTFDGAGSFSGDLVISFGGEIQEGSVLGTYTLAADCTGSMELEITMPGQPPFDSSLRFVLVDDGNEIFTLGTDSGDIAVGAMKKQFPVPK